MSFSVAICIFHNRDCRFAPQGKFIEKRKMRNFSDVSRYAQYFFSRLVCSFSNCLLFLWINERFYVIHHFCCGRKDREWGNWFENLITTAIRIMRSRASPRTTDDSNPYQLTRMIDSSRFSHDFRNRKIQISILEIESNLREWFN